MTKKYLVHGCVQGVGFRYFAYKLSEKLEFNGYVKNLPNGNVEIIIDSKKQEEVLKELEKGNFFSHVEKIEEVETLKNTFEDFKILY